MPRQDDTRTLAFLAPLVAATILAAHAESQSPGPDELDLPVPPRLEAAGAMVGSVVTGAIEHARAHPDDPDARRRLAETLHANAYYAEAETAYQQAHALGQSDARLWHLLAHARHERGDFDGALDASARAIEADPTYPYTHWRRGTWLLDLGRVDDAEAEFLAALEIDPAHQGARFGLVRVHIQRRDPEPAIELIESGLLDGPNAKYAHLLLSRAFRQSGRAEEAAKEAARARGANPALPDPWVNDLHDYSTGYVNEMNQLIAKMRKGEHETVLRETAELHEHYPKDALILEYRASTLWKMGRRQEAAETWRQAMTVDPDNFHPHQSFARTISTGVPPRTRVFALAVNHAQRAVQLKPGDAASRELLGSLLGRAGQTDDAIRQLEIAARLDPTSTMALGKLGELYLMTGRHQDAVDVLRRVVDLVPDSGGGYALLAEAALETGDTDLARDALAEADRLLPRGNPRLDQVRSHLGEDTGWKHTDGGGL